MRMLGMYVHTHWSYNHPYAARTWTLEDWRNYLQGLASLGYDFVMVWPQLDSMPPEPNASDRAFLAKLGSVIRMAHDDFGMKFAITVSPNAIGNDRAASYTFEERPYFICERKVNPRDRDGINALLAGRKRQFEPISHADALVMIDSDPGGYVGSTNEEFVALMRAQLHVFREMNPEAEMIYWMHVGWESYNRFWADVARWKPGEPWPEIRSDERDFMEALSLMREKIREPWAVFSRIAFHVAATEKLGLVAKRWYLPYGLIEGEPTFPLTNCDPKPIEERMSPYSPETYPRGAMANAQTHVLQLPNSYLFAHYAGGGCRETADLPGFADRIFPGCGGKIAGAWEAIAGGDAEAQRSAAEGIRTEVGKEHATGKSSGLLLGDADRFLIDLAMNLDVRAGLAHLVEAVAADGYVRQALRALLKDLRPYQERVGFVDAYGGPLAAGLNEPLAELGDPGINAILDQFHDWRNPAVRHGILPRLLDAAEKFCEEN